VEPSAGPDCLGAGAADVPGGAIVTEVGARELERLRDGDRPFFVCLSYNRPHFPLRPPKRLWERYWPDRADAPRLRADHPAELHPYMCHRGRRTRGRTPRTRARGVPGPMRIVRRGPWKYCWYADTRLSLFNLDEDPHELEDLAADGPRARRLIGDLDQLLRLDWDEPLARASFRYAPTPSQAAAHVVTRSPNQFIDADGTRQGRRALLHRGHLGAADGGSANALIPRSAPDSGDWRETPAGLRRR
jgi:hypothetical protein